LDQLEQQMCFIFCRFWDCYSIWKRMERWTYECPSSDGGTAYTSPP